MDVVHFKKLPNWSQRAHGSQCGEIGGEPSRIHCLLQFDLFLHELVEMKREIVGWVGIGKVPAQTMCMWCLPFSIWLRLCYPPLLVLY